MKKVSPKSTVKAKMKRRRLLTFLRMCRYGVSNFSRNVWLTVAATAIMAVTLLVIFSTLLARNVLIDIVSFVSNRVDMLQIWKSYILCQALIRCLFPFSSQALICCKLPKIKKPATNAGF